jgi:hypothetical protein
METISFDPALVVYGLFTVFAFVALGWITHRLHRWLEKNHSYEVELRDLADRETREGLSAFLIKQNVQGDADIRDGMVYAPVPPDRLDPLATLFMNAAAYYQRLSNPSATPLYIRDAKRDRFMLLGDLDLDHVVDAARVMQRVAEERRKSRGLYKGLTDEEMKAMVRAGLSQAFKDQGNFEMSNTVMRGDWDNHPEFLRAYAVLDLLFKVKGAKGD